MGEPRTTDISVLAEAANGKGAARVRFLGAIVSAASVLPAGEFQLSPLRCRRRPNRCRCLGRIELGRDAAGETIRWSCPLCGDHGLITNWRYSRWDLGPELLSGQVVSLSSARARRAKNGKAYELFVELIDGPVPIDNAVLRRVRIGGSKTLRDLHALLTEAYDADRRASHEFLFGALYEHGARRFLSNEDAPCSTADCRIDTLGWTVGQVFGYVRDLGLRWTHRLTIVSEFSGHPQAQVLERVGHPPAVDEDALISDVAFLNSGEELLNGEAPFDLTGMGEESGGARSDRARGQTCLEDEGDDLGEDLFSPRLCVLPAECYYGNYGAEGSLDPHLWSAMEEVERLLLTLEKHAQALPDGHPPIASALLHALVHHTAERALSDGDAAARHDLADLMRGGISRHEAIHMVGQRLLAAELPASAGNDS